MLKSLYARLSNKVPLLKTILFFLRSLYKRLNPSYLEKDEFGFCNICGKFAQFHYYQLLDSNCHTVVSCEFDDVFIEEMNITNTLRCAYCGSKFRVRCAAQSLLMHFWKGQFRSIRKLIKELYAGNIRWSALETGSYGGIFSQHKGLKNIVLTEYFDEIERGQKKNGIRSEDLQNLTFESNTFDAVIALDVLEHVADPWKAFSEMRRVIRPNGLGIITVPIDKRVEKSSPLARIENGKIKNLRRPAYHLDPFRKEGSRVFTEFGTDILDKLRKFGYNVSWDVYKTERTKVTQYVILLTK
jgi:hypothetical protein